MRQEPALSSAPAGGSEAAPVRWSTDTTHADLGRGLKVLFTVISIAVLSIGLPAFLLADVVDSPRSDAWILTLAVMAWAGFRLTLIWISGIPRLFDFFFWLFTYIFMGIAPTAQMRSGLTSTTTPGVDTGLDMPTAAVVVLGVVCYEVARGVWALREQHVARRQPTEPRPVSAWRTFALFAVSVVLSGYVLSRLGVTALLGSREAAAAARIAAWPDPAIRSIIYGSGVYPLLVSVGALTQVARTALSRRRRRLAVWCAVFGGLVLLMIVNPITSARYTFGTVAFAIAVYLGAVATRRVARITMLATLVGFLFVFPLADTFRRPGGAASTRTGFFDEYLSNPDYDAFWQVANAFSYWIDGLVTPLSQFLGNVLFWVPRSIWPGKPNDTGVMLAEYRGYTFDNLSAPLWAEALVNGGLVAVIVLFLIYGLGARAMDTRMALALRSGGVWAIVGAILPVFTTILLRGSLLQATGALTLTIACMLLVRGPASPPASRDERPLPEEEPLGDARSRTGSGAQVAGVRPIPLDGAS